MLKGVETPPPPAEDAALLARAVAWIRRAYEENRPGVLTALVECRGEGPAVKALVGDDLGDEAKTIFMDSVRYLSIRNASPRAALAYETWIVESDDPAQMRRAQRMVERGQSISRHPLAREMVFVNVESEAGRTMQRLEIRRGTVSTSLTAEADPLFFASDDPGMSSEGTLSGFHVPLALRLTPAVISWAARMDRHAAGMMTAEG